MDKLEPPKGLQLSGNVADNWKKFRQRFELYLEASGAESKEDKTKSCIFLHVIGEYALEIYNNFKFDNDDDKYKLSVILQKFENYCSPKKNLTYERHKFFTCHKKQGETIDQYVNNLRTKASTCEFGDLKDSLIKDRIICGIPNDSLRERLLRSDDLTLDKAITTCRAFETTHERMKELKIDDHKKVNAINKKLGGDKSKSLPHKGRFKAPSKPKHRVSKNPESQNCGRCGRKHGELCPAIGKICNICHKKDHFAKMCFFANKHLKVDAVSDEQTDSSDTDYHDEYFIDSVEINDSKEEWCLNLTTNGRNIRYKLDTGSQVNIISKQEYNKLECKPTIHKTNVKLTSYSGDNVPVKGSSVLNINHKGKIVKLHFIITEKSSTPILGVKACDKLGLVKRVFTIDKEPAKVQTTSEIVEKYDNVFKGLGCLPGEHKIEIDPTVKPVIHPCRKVPFAIHDRLKQELDRMERMGVICKQDGPTRWVSSIVVVQKKNSQLRIWLDPRDLNKAICREHYKLPTREEIMSKFRNAKYFSKLDASSDFWQMKLESESSKLTCFNTPFGLYRFLRLPFGISSAPEVYHKAIHMVFEHVNGVSTLIDDHIIIWGSSMEEHNARLEKVLEITKSVNLKLNRDKCKFGMTELTFIGDVISSEGMKPDHLKVKAIQEFRTPTSKKDVQRFLGMVTYQARYIPNVSTKTAILRKLLEDKIEFQWGEQEENSFNELKNILTSEPVLRFYDPTCEIKISADASKSGLGAVLLQKFDGEWAAVAYASRAMISAETRYAQIEKEMLTITFTCERFHQYIYGKEVFVETDHKPLVALFKKPLNDCPIRIQRLMLRLQKYSLQVSYTPGKLMYTSDALSRAYVDKPHKCDDSGEADVTAYMLTMCCQVCQFLTKSWK